MALSIKNPLAEKLAREVAEEGIRVNAVRAGFVYTDIHASGGEPDRVDRVKVRVPMKRGGTPGEVDHPRAPFSWTWTINKPGSGA